MVMQETMQLEKITEWPKQQWQWQQEEDLLEEQCNWQSLHHGLMAPLGEVSKVIRMHI
jgi:hypothetical protein